LFKLLHVEKFLHDLLNRAGREAERFYGIAAIEFFAPKILRPLPEVQLFLGE